MRKIIAKHIKNVSDGEEVAKVIAATYVVSFCFPGEEFYEYMMERQENIIHDFTMLCFEWLNALSGCKGYDGRNKASVIFARKVSGIISDFNTDRLTKRCESTNSMDFSYPNDLATVLLFEQYLCSSENNDDFIRYMLNDADKVSQQNFSGLCCGWLKHLSETKVNKPYIRKATDIVAEYKGFPFV